MRFIRARVATPFVFLALLFASSAPAQSIVADAQALAAQTPLASAAAAQTSPPPRVAFEYSDAYRLRAKIHKISSFATLPLFGAEAIIGQSLYDNPSGGKKDAHLATAAGIGRGAMCGWTAGSGAFMGISPKRALLSRRNRF